MDNNNPVKELIDEQLASDINEILETVEAGVESFGKHTKDLNNPHQVTKEQVGLGNADNTSDMDKPISNAVSSAIKSLEGKISGVDSAVKTLENKVDSAVNTLNTKVDSAVNTLNNKVDSAVNTLNDKLSSSSKTFNYKLEEVKSSVKTLDSKINSAVNTINGDIAQVRHEINSAIQTLEHGFDSDLETAKQEIIEVVDGFKVNLDFIASSVETLKSQTQSAIETNKTEVLNTVSGIKTSLQSAIETNKANTESAVNTLKGEFEAGKEQVIYCGEKNSHFSCFTTKPVTFEDGQKEVLVIGFGHVLADIRPDTPVTIALPVKIDTDRAALIIGSDGADVGHFVASGKKTGAYTCYAGLLEDALRIYGSHVDLNSKMIDVHWTLKAFKKSEG